MSYAGTERDGLVKKMVWQAFQRMDQAVRDNLKLGVSQIFHECEFEHQWKE